MEDYFNHLKLRNINNTALMNYNCGGYAFETYSWYNPGNTTEYEYILDDYIFQLIEETDDLDIIESLLFSFCVKNILKDFPDYKRISYDEYLKLPKEEKVIAFRTFIDIYNLDKFDEDFDYDFHFKVRNNGIWTHKLGMTAIKQCDLFDWYVPSANKCYDSETAFFIKR